jgi:hypothetical protein
LVLCFKDERIFIADDAFSPSSLVRDQIVQYLDDPGGKINLNSLSATESKKINFWFRNSLLWVNLPMKMNRA